MSKRQQQDSRAAGDTPGGGTTAPVCAAVMPPGGWPPDEYTGIGGCYVRDPVTGVRTPEPAAPTPAAGDAADEPTN